MRYKNIKSEYGDSLVFETLQEFATWCLKGLGYLPEDGLKEGRDYEVIDDKEGVAS